MHRFHTPRGLQEWLDAYLIVHCIEPENPGDVITDQITFVRDKIGGLFFTPEEHKQSNDYLQVLGLYEHDRVSYPIMMLIDFNEGFGIQLSGNRNGWMVSCTLPIELTEDFGSLFEPHRQADTNTASGFRQNELYEPYAVNPSKFTVMFGLDRYKLYYFMRRIREHLRSEGNARGALGAA